MTARHIEAAFEAELVILPLRNLLPLKQVTEAVKRSPKYKCIARSIAEIGVVEPLVAYRKADRRGRHLLLDGLLRREILLEQGQTEAECLLARDDEALTYNKRVNRLAIVQEHLMILRAIDRGVPEAKLAGALNVKIEHIRRRRKLLNGICPEAVSLLREKSVNPVTFDVLRKMKAARQLEACRLMVSAANFSSSYAKALLSASKEVDRMRPERPKVPRIVTSADLALMERELQTIQHDMRELETSYGRDMLDLVIATRYVSRLLERPKIFRYLDENHPEVLKEFRSIVSAASLEERPEGQSEPMKPNSDFRPAPSLVRRACR